MPVGIEHLIAVETITTCMILVVIMVLDLIYHLSIVIDNEVHVELAVLVSKLVGNVTIFNVVIML